MTAGLDAILDVRLGELHLDASIQVAAEQTIALVGQNGAGKTTMLRALAGLHPLDGGRIALDGRVLDEPATATFVEPERRAVGLVFQDHRLLPHLTALDNVAFGLRCRGVARAEARRRSEDWLRAVGLDRHLSSKPSQLSGGQAQRVALARALAAEPVMLLLDEPLAALDASVRAATRRDLRERLEAHAGVRMVVTHDVVDAAALADRIVVLEGGRVVQDGTLADITRRPRSRYVADLVGVNLLRGRASSGRVELGTAALTTTDQLAGDVLVVIPPRAVTVLTARPQGTARNVFPGTVRHLDRLGDDRTRVEIDGAVRLVAEVTAAAVAELGLVPGVAVWMAVKATEVSLAPA